MLFISPPFGNYLQMPKTISIEGSFTLQPRGCLIQQIFNTLRYSPKLNGCVNKIGLRNKGIDWALRNVKQDDIISIAIMETRDIEKILAKLPNDRNIELNVSCPNTEKDMIQNGLQKFLHPSRKWCIIKLSPLSTNEQIETFYKNGFRQFHCCNTLPVKTGGLSGTSIMPYTMDKIEMIKKYKNTTVIAGGGVRSYKDIEKYTKHGADHKSISTVLFNPLVSLYLYTNYLYNYKSM